MLKRKHWITISLALTVTLLGSLAYNITHASPALEKDVQRIVLLDNFVYGKEGGVLIPYDSEIDADFVFSFVPKSSSFNITDIWFNLLLRWSSGDYANCFLDIIFNMYTAFNCSVEGIVSPYHPEAHRLQITDTEVRNHITERLNLLSIVGAFDQSSSRAIYLYKLEMFIEYEYLTGEVVGGLYIPVNKFGLLAPYIALVSTIILAVSISVAYIKYRKKQ